MLSPLRFLFSFTPLMPLWVLGAYAALLRLPLQPAYRTQLALWLVPVGVLWVFGRPFGPLLRLLTLLAVGSGVGLNLHGNEWLAQRLLSALAFLIYL
ncbi:hypothetical protein [Pseudomonas sp. NPDC007930]|uniref:hypothetical protein n=1 Tax=Pseudomonas sp. NPDC007930 TaxID=3364417 RepID=UPI0036ECD1A9